MAADPLPERTGTILAEITDMLVSVVGDELLIVGEVTPATTFNDDLALESIEFVALAELLQQRYGSAVDLLGLLAEKDIDQILAMTVGELAVHIDTVTAADQACTG
ncbi:acyl carrier protein [Streptomyces sp. 2224.1]|uniref:phosphopantetheine-binding protein n=1 Tax=unclassified Streptomyces TaxID=2593676 RepID=UPI000881DD56|nr:MULTISPECIES: phosphopantetheine-binding protein [unclassified Streptomyces]PBC86364.1 acyl carrier protein [Streptomyces sp. 2321.6]SDQ87067.1 acyl carrier protein [Streptomyces sp. KS_16]SED69346.1 acyl carrier protein [Streptomyces sp. 2112.3]SED93322.1 acyl carrier protein [Streptomyces sp. 2224.1]SED96126.1 acyl carrier protein [Streptomyces sp. 2133.1]